MITGTACACERMQAILAKQSLSMTVSGGLHAEQSERRLRRGEDPWHQAPAGGVGFSGLGGEVEDTS